MAHDLSLHPPCIVCCQGYSVCVLLLKQRKRVIFAISCALLDVALTESACLLLVRIRNPISL